MSMSFPKRDEVSTSSSESNMELLSAENKARELWQPKLEAPMVEEDKWVWPSFGALKLEEQDDECTGLWIACSAEGERRSPRLDAWPRFEAPPGWMEVEKEVCARRMEEERELEMMEPEDIARSWMTPSQYRRQWNAQWSGRCGSFEDTTSVPSMRFTKESADDYGAMPMDTLQIFSVKIAAIRGGLQFPLDVFGIVAMRDAIDRNRNIIFCRTRDNCQTLSKADPYLLLAGPTRAVIPVLSSPVVIEVELKVKGTTEYDDKVLSHLVTPFACDDTWRSYLLNRDYTSKLSTLEFRLGHIVCSVEATIFVQVTQGSWPDGFRGVFCAFTTCYKPNPDIDHEKIFLLDSGGEKVIVSGDGKIKLSRCVVSVETSGRLNVSVQALEGKNMIAETTRSFGPSNASRSCYKYNMGFCEMLVTVVWSLLSDVPVRRRSFVETTKEVETTEKVVAPKEVNSTYGR